MTNSEIGCFIDHMHDHYGDLWTESQVEDSHYARMSLSDAIAERSSLCEMQQANLTSLYKFSLTPSDDEN